MTTLIIGAGIGGLSTAIRLAAAGQRVIVFEKNERVGGKMYEHRADGFRWDTGPSVITMRHVFEELFASAEAQLSDYLTLEPVDPLTRYFFADGTRLDASGDLSKMAAQIEAIEPRDVEGYLAYLAYAARIHRITGPVFIYDEPPRPQSFLRVPVNEWLKVDPFRTMQQSIESFVISPQMRQLLGRFATYVGGSPYEAPATLNVIAHVELTGGVWYSRGGIYAIARAFERLALELGVEIRTDSAVAKIMVDDGRAVGVVLASGEQVTGSAVVSNLDVTMTYDRLLTGVSAVGHGLGQGLDHGLGQSLARPLATLKKQEPSCSGFVLLLGMAPAADDEPDLAHHNIFFSVDYKREFEQIFKQGVPPDDPTVYVAITSKTDAADAPAGHENWFVLVNAPAVNEIFDWETEAAAYRDRVLGVLARHGVDLGRVCSETLLTPNDLQTMSGAWRGALYGASANSKFTAFRRPHNRSPHIRGLYFAGGTTHPGGGVPMVTLSGGVAAKLVLEDADRN